MSYTQKVLEELKARYPEQPEFIQAATEILGTIQPALDAHPEYEEAALLERLPKEYGKDRVFLSVYDDNQGAIRLYEKLGFVHLGRIPGGFKLKDGTYEDILPFYIELSKYEE